MDGQISREIARRAEIEMLYNDIGFMEAMVSLLKKNPDLLEKFVQELSSDTV